jgi:hypothetical protein
VLQSLHLDSRTLSLEVAPSGAPHVIEVIGDGGRVLGRVDGDKLAFETAKHPSRYWRVRVSRLDGAGAWTQPVWP